MKQSELTPRLYIKADGKTNTKFVVFGTDINSYSQGILCANNEKHNHPNNITLARILSLYNTPNIHLSSDNSSLVEKINNFKSLGFNINESYPTNGVNTLCYEYK